MTQDPRLVRGVEVTAVDGGFQVQCVERDWLRAALVCLGFATRIVNNVLQVTTGERDRLAAAVHTALAPAAALFDLDGVLVDLSRNRRMVDVEVLRRLRATRPIGVVTTCSHEMAVAVLQHHGLLALCGAVITSDDGPAKPDPFPVRLALERLGTTTAWMLGDNPSDVRAARGAQVLPFAILPRGIGAESHADRLRAAGALQLLPDAAAFAGLLAARPTA